MTPETVTGPKFYEVIEKITGRKMKARDIDLLASIIAVSAYRDGLLTEADIERLVTEFRDALK